uniref:Uncharacterized protein n=1 Tax=Enterobacter hormaechei subsp. xiangfangensis TaxID=1296536 RepID=A0A6C0L1R7_9ENTR|nr:hypothetical protein pLAU_ENM30_NDM1_00021 [Enterobacter hormaechei subsp. xiangfangensis]
MRCRRLIRVLMLMYAYISIKIAVHCNYSGSFICINEESLTDKFCHSK